MCGPNGTSAHQYGTTVPQFSLLDGVGAYDSIAFLDDICVVCAPERVGEVYLVLEQQLREKPGINIHLGKTKIVEQSGRQAGDE